MRRKLAYSIFSVMTVMALYLLAGILPIQGYQQMTMSEREERIGNQNRIEADGDEKEFRISSNPDIRDYNSGMVIEHTWNTGGKSHPQSLRLYIYQDDVLLDEVVLNTENQWQIQLDHLDGTQEYVIKSEELNGYAFNCKKEGNIYRTISTSSLANTGSSVYKMPLLAAFGVLLVVMGIQIVHPFTGRHRYE